jgi:hypothetical protein
MWLLSIPLLDEGDCAYDKLLCMMMMMLLLAALSAHCLLLRMMVSRMTTSRGIINMNKLNTYVMPKARD